MDKFAAMRARQFDGVIAKLREAEFFLGKIADKDEGQSHFVSAFLSACRSVWSCLEWTADPTEARKKAPPDRRSKKEPSDECPP